MQDANVKETRSACHKLALECHPDKFQRHADTAKVLFQQLQRIQDVLSDPQQRREYDAKLEMQRHTSFAQRHMGRNEHPWSQEKGAFDGWTTISIERRYGVDKTTVQTED